MHLGSINRVAICASYGTCNKLLVVRPLTLGRGGGGGGGLALSEVKTSLCNTCNSLCNTFEPPEPQSRAIPYPNKGLVHTVLACTNLS